MVDLCVKTGTRLSLRDKRLFEISEFEITRVDCNDLTDKENEWYSVAFGSVAFIFMIIYTTSYLHLFQLRTDYFVVTVYLTETFHGGVVASGAPIPVNKATTSTKKFLLCHVLPLAPGSLILGARRFQ